MVHEIKYFALPKTTKCLYRRNLTQIGIKRIERKQMTVMFHLTDSVVPKRSISVKGVIESCE